MKFVDNARKWYKMFSVQGLIVISSIQTVVIALPASVVTRQIPFFDYTWSDMSSLITFLIAVLTAIGRLIKQESLTEEQP